MSFQTDFPSPSRQQIKEDISIFRVQTRFRDLERIWQRRIVRAGRPRKFKPGTSTFVDAGAEKWRSEGHYGSRSFRSTLLKLQYVCYAYVREEREECEEDGALE